MSIENLEMHGDGTVYAPIRLNREEDYNWIDTNCIAPSLYESKVKAERYERDLAYWNSLNPVQRYAQFKLEEI